MWYSPLAAARRCPFCSCFSCCQRGSCVTLSKALSLSLGFLAAQAVLTAPVSARTMAEQREIWLRVSSGHAQLHLHPQVPCSGLQGPRSVVQSWAGGKLSLWGRIAQCRRQSPGSAWCWAPFNARSPFWGRAGSFGAGVGVGKEGRHPLVPPASLPRRVPSSPLLCVAARSFSGIFLLLELITAVPDSWERPAWRRSGQNGKQAGGCVFIQSRPGVRRQPVVIFTLLLGHVRSGLPFKEAGCE